MRTDKIGKTATQVYGQGMEMNVRYHDTVVVSFNDKQITLNSGGWKTRTTKLRMNQTSNQYGLGFMVVQKHFEWQVLFQGETLDYTDGMVLERKPVAQVA